MNLEWASRWISSFSVGVDAAMEFYADDCDFRDFPLEHIFLNAKPGLARAFIPFAHADPANGRGIHHFAATAYNGDYTSGVVRLRWNARHGPAFFGLPQPHLTHNS